jgi:very-long-chain enoyl-CoA reductase
LHLIVWPEWTAASIAGYAALALFTLSAGVLEHFDVARLRYSRFRTGEGLSSRTGMLLIYGVPLTAHVALSFAFLATASATQILVFAAVSGHFAKRCLEVLFVHRYSGPIDPLTTGQITVSYTLTAVLAAWLNARSTAPADATLGLGAALYVIGIAGNFHHHRLLARLRESRAGYVVPTGGLFDRVSCPHYLFELIGWLGIAVMSRELGLYLVALGMAGYLAVRARKVHAWYRERFSDYPAERRALVPGLF